MLSAGRGLYPDCEFGDRGLEKKGKSELIECLLCFLRVESHLWEHFIGALFSEDDE